MAENDTGANGGYQTEMQCEVCYEHFGVTFDDPSETFSATCPHCNTYYPEECV